MSDVEPEVEELEQEVQEQPEQEQSAEQQSTPAPADETPEASLIYRISCIVGVAAVIIVFLLYVLPALNKGEHAPSSIIRDSNDKTYNSEIKDRLKDNFDGLLGH